VWSANRASWNIKRPCGVPNAFQVIKHGVEAQVDEANNILSNNPRWPTFFDKPKIFRPEMAHIFFCQLFSGLAEWLARKSPANNINWSDAICV